MANDSNTSLLQRASPGSSPSTNTVPTIVSVIFLIVSLIITVFGNTLVCIACFVSKRLQNYTSAFIVSLAVSDILVGLVSMPVWISVQLIGEPNMVTMPTVYTMWLCLDILCGTASIMNLVFISIDRFLAVNYPLHYQGFVSRERVTMAIVFLWGYAVLIAGLYPLRWSAYAIFVSISAFFAPLIIMIGAYSRIFKVALTHARTIRVQTVQSARNTGGLDVVNIRQDLKAARTLSIVIGTFVFSWCPFFVMVLLSTYCKSCIFYQPVVVVVKLLHYGNSAMNPIIYSCLNKYFRSTFKAIILRGFHHVCCGTTVETFHSRWHGSDSSNIGHSVQGTARKSSKRPGRGTEHLGHSP